MEFLNPKKPTGTCISETYDNCIVSNALHCHFTLRDLMHFLLIVLPSFLPGGAGIYHMGGWWLISWLIMIIGYFGFVEIRVMCSHCPHYSEKGSSLKCWDADKAETIPHNIKVFNLCLINRLGLEKWAKSRASEIRNTYFTKPWTLRQATQAEKMEEKNENI